MAQYVWSKTGCETMASRSFVSCFRAGRAGRAGTAGGDAWWHAARKMAAPIVTLRVMRIVAFVIGVITVVSSAVQPSGGRDVHLTLHEGTSMAAAMSPDGRTIAIDLLGTIWT